MIIIRNIPGMGRLFYSLYRFKKYVPGIEEANKAGDIELEKQRIAESTQVWAQTISHMYGMKVQFRGKENIPDHDGLVFISNHQGYGDIIAMLLATEGRQISFIAKDQLRKIPLFGYWIKVIRGVFIERGNAKASLKSISEAAELVKQGFNMVIFPEGTRSRGGEMIPFKPGSFKLATKAKATIVPVTIHGTYDMFETRGTIGPSSSVVYFHPPVETASLDRHALREMEGEIETSIRTKLAELREEKNSGGF
jgi:1-acyl-sn-glycerol-3-phosphate acyltransferase